MPAIVHALSPPPLVDAGLIRDSTGRRRPPASGPVRLLALAAIVCAVLLLLSVVDGAGLRLIWDNLHWSGSATAAAIATVWSIRGTGGRVRAVRTSAAVAFVLWMIANLAWAWLNLQGLGIVASRSDPFVLAIVLPGVGVLVATVRGRLSAAEEIAVYLDAALTLLLIATVFILIHGPIAIGLPSGAGFVALAYPTAFIGLAGGGLIALLAVGYPIAMGGASALIGGSALIGLAYLGWIVPAVTGAPAGKLPSLLFTIGTLTAAYGAVTWSDVRSASPRYLAAARIATRIVASLVASILVLAVLVPVPDSIATMVHVAIFGASILFIVRQGLLLRERTTMLTAVTTLTRENYRLVAELRAELERRAADQRRMIQASRAAAVGVLAAGVAHEVNNPLTGVLGFAELLLEEMPGDDPRRPDVATIRLEALRAREIVRALGDFASPRPPSPVDTDLSALVRRTIDLARFGIERRGVSIREDLPALPAIRIDAQAVQQAILNVITNANEAVAAGGRIEVAVRAERDGRLVTIVDDGVGMDAETAGLAFEPFFSAREVPEGSEPATGLGLSISTGLIESHGGTITINSRPGAGTTVEIRLPARPSPSAIADVKGQLA
ncbi:MAG: hypothetical protein H0V73_01715 [Chloroflexi bacterium]|nr:hypothetical protein [Chloroflexota bacterium]